MDWDRQARTLAGIYARHYPGLTARAYDDVEADLGRAVPRDPFLLDRLTSAIAATVQGVTATQRDRIAALVNQYTGDRAGLTAALTAIQDGVAARAAVIARTTVTHALNAATAAAVQADGHSRVYITDGTDDPGCAAVAGTYQTGAWLAAHTAEHPNCTRRGVAVDVAEVPHGL